MRSRHHRFRSRSAQYQYRSPAAAQQQPVSPPFASEVELPPLEQDAASLRREKSELYQQLFEAAQIQRRLSGPRVLRRGELQCAREVFAARYLSGDFAVFLEQDGKVIAALGDIAGKGTPAGMWFTHLVGLLQRYAVAGADPAQIAAEINRHLCCLRPLAPFVTMFLAEVDPSSGEFLYCNAGHFPPVLLRAHTGFSTLETGGPLLGALEEGVYELGRNRVNCGDTLLAYSDGVLECRNGEDEEFGLDRLVTHAQRLTNDSAQMALLTILGAVQDFGAGSPVCDDMSLMVIRRTIAPVGLAA